MIDFQICVISNDPELVQQINSTLTSHRPSIQDQSKFILYPSTIAELLSLDDFKGIAVLIVDGEIIENNQNHFNTTLIDIPKIVLLSKSADRSSLEFCAGSPTIINKGDISNSLFPVVLSKTISEIKYSRTLLATREKLNNQIKTLQSLRQISLQLTENLSLEEVLESILTAAKDLTGADDCIIFLDEYGSLKEGKIWGFGGDINEFDTEKRFQYKKYAITPGGCINPVDEDSLPSFFIYDDFRGSIYVVDLNFRNKWIGGLLIGFRDTHHFSKIEKDALQMLADQAAIAIENARLFKISSKVAIIDERQRLAQELHDSVAQALYGITLFSKASQKIVVDYDSTVLINQLETIQKTALYALREMRLLLFELRPATIEDGGLIPALTKRLESVEERSGINVHFSWNGNLTLSEFVQENIYRIAQEAMNNVLKHSGANNLTLFS